jgi:hypothetical protein
MVTLMIYKYLGFVFQPAKSSGVDDPITVPLERRAIRMILLLIFSSFSFLAFHRVRRQILFLLFLHICPDIIENLHKTSKNLKTILNFNVLVGSPDLTRKLVNLKVYTPGGNYLRKKFFATKNRLAGLSAIRRIK